MVVCHKVSCSTPLAGWTCPTNFAIFNLVHRVNSFFFSVSLFMFCFLSFLRFWHCFRRCRWFRLFLWRCCWFFFFLWWWCFLGHYAAASSLGFSGGLLRFLMYSGSTTLACSTVWYTLATPCVMLVPVFVCILLTKTTSSPIFISVAMAFLTSSLGGVFSFGP